MYFFFYSFAPRSLKLSSRKISVPIAKRSTRVEGNFVQSSHVTPQFLFLFYSLALPLSRSRSLFIASLRSALLFAIKRPPVSVFEYGRRREVKQFQSPMDGEKRGRVRERDENRFGVGCRPIDSIKFNHLHFRVSEYGNPTSLRTDVERTHGNRYGCIYKYITSVYERGMA